MSNDYMWDMELENWDLGGDPVDYSGFDWSLSPVSGLSDDAFSYGGYTFIPNEDGDMIAYDEATGRFTFPSSSDTNGFNSVSSDGVWSGSSEPSDPSLFSSLGSYLTANWPLVAGGVLSVADMVDRYENSEASREASGRTTAQNQQLTDSTVLDRDWGNFNETTKLAGDQTTSARDNALLRQYLEVTEPYNRTRDEAVLKSMDVDISGLGSINTDNSGYLKSLLGYEDQFNRYATDLLDTRNLQTNYDKLVLPQSTQPFNVNIPIPIPGVQGGYSMTVPMNRTGTPAGAPSMNIPQPDYSTYLSSIPEGVAQSDRDAYLSYLREQMG